MQARKFPVIWLTGNTGAGKTTLAMSLENQFNEGPICDSQIARRVIVLDGDEMRATISTTETLTAGDRRTHNLRVARLAKMFQNHGFLVIVAVIAPFSHVRREIDVICSPLWVYVKRSGIEGPNRPYEPPPNPNLMIDNDICTIDQGEERLMAFVKKLILSPTHFLAV